MRYYHIKIFDTANDKIPSREFFSHTPDGKNIIPGALNIELDIPICDAMTPTGSAYVRVWGIGVDDINQASDFNLKTIEVWGGMRAGLPLANPTQQGLLVRGQIFPAFGNWQGVDMSLDFIIAPGAGSSSAPVQITINANAGELLSTALKTSLDIAFPSHKVTVLISDDIVPSNDIIHYCESCTQLIQMIDPLARSLNKNSASRGVKLVCTGTEILVYDGTDKPSSVLELSYLDFIGQPTWIDGFIMQAKFVMRADMALNQHVKFPDPPHSNTVKQQTMPIVNTSQSSPFVRAGLSFSGEWQIDAIRHVGNFRQADANAWVTVVNFIAPIAP